MPRGSCERCNTHTEIDAHTYLCAPCKSTPPDCDTCTNGFALFDGETCQCGRSMPAASAALSGAAEPQPDSNCNDLTCDNCPMCAAYQRYMDEHWLDHAEAAL